MSRQEFSATTKRKAYDRAPAYVECLCAGCGAAFIRPYRMSTTRKAKPQYCSRECVTTMASARARASLAARVWSRINVLGDGECWQWVGRRSKNGYGRIDIGGAPRLAHRVVFEIVTGERPHSVCHRCDNPPCCNPSHLFGGTQADNIADMIAKGRKVNATRRGVLSNTAKLSEDAVVEIFNSNEPNIVLANRYSVSDAAIRLIKIGRNWAWLTGGANAAS